MNLKTIKEIILWMGFFLIVLFLAIDGPNTNLMAMFFFILTIGFYYGIKYFVSENQGE